MKKLTTIKVVKYLMEQALLSRILPKSVILEADLDIIKEIQRQSEVGMKKDGLRQRVTLLRAGALCPIFLGKIHFIHLSNNFLLKNYGAYTDRTCKWSIGLGRWLVAGYRVL